MGIRFVNMKKLKKKTFVFGYEESYGCVVKDFVRDKDAVQAVVNWQLKLVTIYKKQGKDLVDVLNELICKTWYI